MPSLREINRYCTMLDNLQEYLDSHSQSFGDWTPYSGLVRYLFAPLALALAVEDAGKYDAFISGQGTDILKTFLKDSEKSGWDDKNPGFTETFIKRSPFPEGTAQPFKKPLEEITDVTEAIDFVVKSYEKLFSPEKKGSGNEAFSISVAFDEFERTTNLLRLTAQD